MSHELSLRDFSERILAIFSIIFLIESVDIRGFDFGSEHDEFLDRILEETLASHFSDLFFDDLVAVFNAFGIFFEFLDDFTDTLLIHIDVFIKQVELFVKIMEGVQQLNFLDVIIFVSLDILEDSYVDFEQFPSFQLLH